MLIFTGYCLASAQQRLGASAVNLDTNHKLLSRKDKQQYYCRDAKLPHDWKKRKTPFGDSRNQKWKERGALSTIIRYYTKYFWSLLVLQISFWSRSPVGQHHLQAAM